jgi:hypothetical protein
MIAEMVKKIFYHPRSPINRFKSSKPTIYTIYRNSPFLRWRNMKLMRNIWRFFVVNQLKINGIFANRCIRRIQFFF